MFSKSKSKKPGYMTPEFLKARAKFMKFLGLGPPVKGFVVTIRGQYEGGFGCDDCIHPTQREAIKAMAVFVKNKLCIEGYAVQKFYPKPPVVYRMDELLASRHPKP